MKGHRCGGLRRIDVALIAVSAILAAAALGLFCLQAKSDADYSGLAAQATAETDVVDTEGDRAGIDWDGLLAQNGDLVGWIKVDGTGIDHPVVRASDDKSEDFYLTHDFWGARSAAGCPYLDRRCRPDGSHLMIYGHSMGLSSSMFGSIWDAYKQERFDQIGAATWSTPGSGTERLRPLCALRVPSTYARIQKFGIGSGDLSAWLRGLCAEAGAVSTEWREMCEGAGRAVTLVTCSQPWSGAAERTLLVLVSP